MIKPVAIVVACDTKRGIGIHNTLPWHLKADMAYFKTLTTTTKDPDKHNLVIMGRKTWESIPDKYRPLPGRENAILSRGNFNPNCQTATVFNTFDSAITYANSNTLIETIFIIGGAQLYKLSLNAGLITHLYLTEIKASHTCDAFFPTISSSFTEVSRSKTQSEGDIAYTFVVYKRA